MDVIVFRNGTVSGTYAGPRENDFFFIFIDFIFLLSIVYSIVLRAFQQYCTRATCPISDRVVALLNHSEYNM